MFVISSHAADQCRFIKVKKINDFVSAVQNELSVIAIQFKMFSSKMNCVKCLIGVSPKLN